MRTPRQDRGLAAALRRLPLPVRGERPPLVAVFCGPDGRDSPEVRAVRRAFPEARLLVRDARWLAQRDRILRRNGPVDLVVVLSPASPAQHRRQLRDLVPHLVPGGMYVVDRRAIDAGRDLETTLAPRGLVSRVWSDERLVGVVKGPETLLKLRHEEATQLVNRRAGDLTATELAVLPGGVLPPPPRVVVHGGGGQGLDAEMRYPPLQLRRYTGDLTLTPGALVYADGVLLPDSFRWHLADRLDHPRLVDVRGGFARPKQGRKGQLPNLPQADRLTGAYYHFDYVNTGHYGHLMTEALSKLWGWETAKAADPDLKLLSRTHPRYAGTGRVPPDIELLTRYGVDPADIVRVDGPVKVGTLVAAAPMWHNQDPFYAHPGITEVWDRLREGMVQPDRVASERIFVSRREGGRPCRNVEAVEALFADAGFEIVLPGGLSQPEQAAVFAGARVVAGFAGTGMFNLAYAHRAEQVIVLSQESYDARNEHLFAAVHGAAIAYFFSPAEIAHPEGGWSYEAFQSPWSFDFDRNGAALDALLRDRGRA
ncbi:MAG: glycosyltransferase 61 family protein [Nocardioides sp.]